MKPAVFLYGVPGQYGNYAAALEAAGARVVLCRDLYRSLDCDGLLLPGGGDIRGPLPGTETFLVDSFVRVPAAHPGHLPGNAGAERLLGRHPAGYFRPPAAPGRYGAPHPGGGDHGAAAGGAPCRYQLPPSGGGPPGRAPAAGAQWAEDGVTEAVVHQELPVLGVQWHPERQSYALCREDAPDAREIFRYFVTQMKETP